MYHSVIDQVEIIMQCCWYKSIFNSVWYVLGPSRIQKITKLIKSWFYKRVKHYFIQVSIYFTKINLELFLSGHSWVFSTAVKICDIVEYSTEQFTLFFLNTHPFMLLLGLSNKQACWRYLILLTNSCDYKLKHSVFCVLIFFLNYASYVCLKIFSYSYSISNNLLF